MNLVKVMIDGVSKTMDALRGAVGSFFGINTSGFDAAKHEIAKDIITGRERGKTFMQREKNQRIQEQHTARMFTSTYQHTGDSPVEPSVFYANTVKFPYNLFDFWLRTEEKAFICR